MNRRPRLRLLIAAPLTLLLAACQQGAARPAAGMREVWRWDAPPPAFVGMPAADAKVVAFSSALSRLVVLDASGHVLWVAESARLRDVAPRLTPDLIVAATERGLAGFHRASGSAAWSADLGERANTPALAGDTLVASTWDSSLFGVDLATGTVKWRSSLPGAALGPATSDGQVAVTTWVADDHTAAGAVAVDAMTGQLRWAVPLPTGGVSAPAISAAGVVVVVAGDLAAHGVDLTTGVELWRAGLEGAGSPEVPPLAIAGGDVLVGHRLGGMVLLGPGGRPRWQVGSDGAAVRGGPTGPSPGGRFALPLDDGRLLLAGPVAPTTILDPPGRVNGVATGPDGLLLASTREASANGMTASSRW